MTTTIVVKANHGSPVDVFAHDKPGDEHGNTTGVLIARVPPGEIREFSVHSHRDLFVHEVQPDEADAPNVEAD